MSLFLILIKSDSNENAANAMKNQIENAFEYHQYDDRVYLIRSKETPKEISGKIGLIKEQTGQSVRGTILQLTGDYWGLERPDVWSWLENHNS